ncbi:hypothetical protein JCM14124_16150 [Humidesulfovibrio idahonensis]
MPFGGGAGGGAPGFSTTASEVHGSASGGRGLAAPGPGAVGNAIVPWQVPGRSPCAVRCYLSQPQMLE